MRLSFRAVSFAGAVLFVATVADAIPVHTWSKRFGNASDQIGNATAMDAAGNVFATGELNGTADFGGGPLTSGGGADVFLAKLNAGGTHLWSQRFGTGADQMGMSVAADASGNVVITGELNGSADFGGGTLTSVGNSDIFLAKYNSSGTHTWSLRFGNGSAQIGRGVATDQAGNVVVVGEFAGTVNFGGGNLTSVGGLDIFVAKLDAGGTHVWSQRFGDASDQLATAVAVDGSGNVLVTGTMAGTVNFGGGNMTSGGSSDAFLAKFNAGGTHVWSKRFGSTAAQSGSGVAVDVTGNVVAFTGYINGSADFGGGVLTSAGGADAFIARYDANGTHVWSRRCGATGQQFGASLVAVSSGDVVVAGRFQNAVDFGGGALTSAGSYDVFLAKYNAAGTHLWSYRYGDASSQYGNGVAADGVGGIALVGRIRGSVDFGGGALTSAGGIDAVLAGFIDTFFVPTLIRSFEAIALDAAVEVRWDVWSDESPAGFTLYRKEDAAPLPTAIASGEFDVDAQSYLDRDVQPGNRYSYELVVRTRDGDEVRSPLVTATVRALGATLGQNRPNPFNPTTTIEYTLAERSRVSLAIYDATGALVVRVDRGTEEAGTYRVDWNGRDELGRAASSGVYLYRLEGVKGLPARKMILLK